MAFHLFLSNSLERLADKFAENLCFPMQGKDPFAPVYTAVANTGMSVFLKRHLARKHNLGIAANLECPFIQKFITDTMGKFFAPEEFEQFRKSVNFWSPDVLSWRIDSLIAAEQEMFPDFTEYWSGDAMKRHLLSCELARCFDRYQIYRSSCSSGSARILSEWRSGQNCNSSQSRLYRKLCDMMPDPDSFYLKFFASEKSPALPERIGVFSISAMPALHLRCLKKFAEHSEIYLFCPSPCQVYWGDMKNRQETLKAMKAAPPEEAAEILESAASGNQLLADLGTTGREFFNLLLDEDCFSGSEGEELFCDPAEEENVTALHMFQSDILNARARSEADAFKCRENDDSLRINCCSGPRRELEILHDQLLELFYRKSKKCSDQKSFKVTEDLRPEDVIVMFPDINKAAPLIDAVFSAGPFKNRYAICDRSTAGQSQVIECFSRLLDLPGTRCTSEDIIELLEFECLSSKLGIKSEDMPIISELVSRSRICWGLDEKEHHDFRNNGFKEFSWQDGIDRLLTEYARGEDISIIYSPCETGGIDGNTAGVFGIAAEFISTLKKWRSDLLRARTPGEWGEFMYSWIQTFFSGGSREYQPEISALLQAVGKIVRGASAADDTSSVEPEIFIARLKSEYSLTGGKQHFLRDKITFCSLVPLRAVPAKVIAILGLNDGEFPGVSTPKSFDLMKTIRRNDPQMANDNRYLFLEAIMAAREYLILSYVGLVNGQELFPALPLGTMEKILKEAFGIEKKAIPLKALELETLHAFRPAVKSVTAETPPLQAVAIPEKMDMYTLQELLTQNCSAFFKLRYGFDCEVQQKETLLTDDPENISALDESILLRSFMDMRLEETAPDIWFDKAEKARMLPVNSRDLFEKYKNLIEEVFDKFDLGDKSRDLVSAECSCKISTENNAPLELYKTLEFKESDEKIERTVLHYSHFNPQKLMNFYLEHLLLSAVYAGKKSVTGRIIFIRPYKDNGGKEKIKFFDFKVKPDADKKLEDLVTVALRSYKEDMPLPIFAGASYACANGKSDVFKKFVKDMKYNGAVGLFFTEENFNKGEFESLAGKIFCFGQDAEESDYVLKR